MNAECFGINFGNNSTADMSEEHIFITLNGKCEKNWDSLSDANSEVSECFRQCVDSFAVLEESAREEP